MTKDKAYEATKKLGERAGHDETVLARLQPGSETWRSVDTTSGSPGDKINIEISVEKKLPRVELELYGLDVETAERIIDLVKERDAAVRLGAEVAEAAAAVKPANPMPASFAAVVKAAFGLDDGSIPPGGDAGPRGRSDLR